jgi:ATP-dependent DNA helicase PIF1
VQNICDGAAAYLPRARLVPAGGAFPPERPRAQFPVKVAFAMTINKAQGQTLDRAIVFLREPVFSRGQLYVAAPRVGDPASLRFATPDPEAGCARNAAYGAALA